MISHSFRSALLHRSIAFLAWVLFCCCPTFAADAEPFDVLIIAPHSDDEAIGCTGVILQAVERKQRVGVVVVTAGDGFPKAAAALAKTDIAKLEADHYLALSALRQRHTLQAMPTLGVQAEDIMFLGYPDGGLAKMYEGEPSAVYRSPLTGKSETYGIVVGDYHSQVHDRPAPYMRESVVADLAEIIRTRKPREIYATHESDVHPDHRATFWYTREAARAAGHVGPLWTYVVHGKPPAEPAGKGRTLSDSELKRKRATIEIYQAGVSPVHDDLAEKYALPEERFWAVKVER